MRQPLLKNQEGMVLVTSLMFMMILFILATTAYLITSSDLKISSNYKTSKQAFYVADAGVERAIAVLKNTKDFTDILQGADEDPDELADNGILSFGSSVNFADGTYNVVITDNVDEPPGSDPNVDTNDPYADVDKKVYITSTGTKDGATSTIVVLFWGDHIPVKVPGAVSLLGPGPGVEMGAGPGGPALINGNDHDLPEDFICSGANCEGAENSDPGVPGLYVEVPPTDIDPADYVDAPIVGPPSVAPNVLGDPTAVDSNTDSSNLAEWLTLVDTAVPDVTLSGSTTIASNTSYGDRDNPVVVLIDGDVDIHASGNIDGAGILIVKGNFQITGTFHWEGIVIVSSDADLTVDATGRVILLGALVVAPDGGASATVELNGHASVNYSSEAIRNAEDALDNATIISWQNQYTGENN